MVCYLSLIRRVRCLSVRGRRALRVAGSMLAALILLTAAAHGQMVANDDSYSVPYGQDLMVEAPGVLANDTFDGNPAEEHGATAELVGWPSYGYLSCEAEPTFELCPDGSFIYTPYLDFPGIDTFTYEAVVGTDTSLATVALTACGGGLLATQTVCWKEGPYLAKLGELGYQTFQEGFEDDAAWDASPSTTTREPDTAPSALSQGITWKTNHPDPPASNEIQTGTGPNRTGLWGGLRSPPRLCNRDSRRLRRQLPGPRVSVSRRFHGNP